MKAPEKLYLHPTAKGEVGASWLTFSLTNEDIEYTRTDALKDQGLKCWNGEIVEIPQESEDERIKKEILDLVSISGNGNQFEEIKDWLEKQGEQKPIVEMKSPEESLMVSSEEYNDIVNECIYGEQKPTDKVEPKFNFKAGQWIVATGKCVYLIVKIDGYNVTLVDTNGDEYVFDVSSLDDAHEWNIADAKAGDVLVCESGWTCIFKALDNHTNTFSSYCFMDKDKWFCNTGSECHTLDKAFIKAYNGEINPATKEQRDLLFAKMKEAGYEWDAKKKELKKIDKKLAWSDEDEKILNTTISFLSEYAAKGYENAVMCMDWLKSLKQRMEQ